MGERRHRPHLTVEGGGSSGRRDSLQQIALQDVANRSGLTIHFSHCPPGTPNGIRVNIVCSGVISMNWRGRVLQPSKDRPGAVPISASTRGQRCESDFTPAPIQQSVHPAAMVRVNLIHEPFHGEWNYVMVPQS